MFKKITSGFLAVLMMVSAFVIVPPQIARAEVFGNYTYTIEGNAVTITAVAKTIVGAVEIPDRLPDVAGKPVTKIVADAFKGCTKMTSLKIPASVTVIDTDVNFASCSILTAFTVDNANTAFTAVDGVLFNKDQTILRHYPVAKAETAYTIPNTVTSIGDNAFNSCSKLATVTMGTGVASLGINSFNGCSALTAIDIPNKVTSIGENAFFKCTSLATVTLGTGITNIGSGTFFMCSALTAIAIPNSVTSIGGDVFNGCVKLATATIGTGVASIGNNVFYDCSELTAIEIPNTVTSMGNGVFNGCVKLATATIGTGVTSIGNNAFRGCSALTAIAISDKVTSIGNDAFSGCSKLATATIGTDVTSIGNNAFRGCSTLTAIVIPDKVTSIGIGAFRGCSALTAIAIPNKVTSIGNDTFNGCVKLATATIGTGVTSIGIGAFRDCSELTAIAISNAVTSIGNDAFNGCSKLATATIGTGVESIGTGAFKDCSALTAISIPDKVTSIANDTFNGCVKLATATIGTGVTSIGASAFMRTALTAISISDKVITIGNSAFADCGSLTIIAIPNSVTSIGDHAFYKCAKLATVTIGRGVATIGDYAFVDCGALTLFTVDSANTAFISVDGILFNKNKTTLINYPAAKTGTTYTIPNTVTSIGNGAFFGCKLLVAITIGTDVTNIGKEAFVNCSGITTMVIPNNVTTIGDSAFVGCSALTTINIPANVATIGTNVFENCSALTVFTVDSANTVVESEAGVLFNKGKTILINYPTAKADTSYTVPASVTTIKTSSFYKCQKLTSVVIPDTVTTIEDNAFVIPTTVKINSNVGSAAYTYATKNKLLGESSIIIVDDLTLIAPVAGATQRNATTTNEFYDVTTTTWSKDGIDLAVGVKFAVSSTYNVTVVLTAKTNYKFTDLTTFAGYTKKEMAANGSTLTLEKAFPATNATEPVAIDTVTVTGITAPVRGERQTTAVSGNAAKYTAITTWNQKDGEIIPPNVKFDGGNEYVVTIVLTAMADNKFIDTTAIPTGYTKTLGIDGTTLTIVKLFPATEANLIAAVTVKGIVAPVTAAGQSTATVDDDAQYTVTTTKWYKGTSTTAIGAANKFEVDSVYRVEILLTAKAKHKFTDATTFGDYTKKAMAANASTLTLERSFPMTVANLITDVILTGITAPVTGTKPTTAASGNPAKYTVMSTTWGMGGSSIGINDKFQASSVYTAIVVLKATTGNKFTDDTIIPAGYMKKGPIGASGNTLIIERIFQSTKYIKLDMNGDNIITIEDGLLALKTETTTIAVNPLVDSDNTALGILNSLIS